MVYSMTGYGKGEARGSAGAVTVEVRTVNHRFIDFAIRLPRPLNGYEKEIEKIVRGSLKRGHIYVTVAFDHSVETESVAINKDIPEEGVPGPERLRHRGGNSGTDRHRHAPRASRHLREQSRRGAPREPLGARARGARHRAREMQRDAARSRGRSSRATSCGGSPSSRNRSPASRRRRRSP